MVNGPWSFNYRGKILCPRHEPPAFERRILSRANYNAKYSESGIQQSRPSCVEMRQSLRETSYHVVYRLRKDWNGGSDFRLSITRNVTMMSKRNAQLPWPYLRGHVTNRYKISTRTDVVAWQKLAQVSGEIFMRKNVQMILVSDITVNPVIEKSSLTISFR